MSVNPAINQSLETVSLPNIASSAVNAPVDQGNLDQTAQNIDQVANQINYNPSLDGDNTFKETFVALAEADMRVSETEMIVYDGAYSSYQTELSGVRSRLASKESEFAQKEATYNQESAKTNIETEINEAGNAVFTTAGGFTIETDTNQGGHQTWIRNAEGETMAHIHGDPHVDLNADGADDFHFGDNSSFVLEDGTEVFLNTQNVAGTDEAGGYTHSKVFFTTGVYVKAGDNIVQTGDDTADDGDRENGFRTNVDASEMNIGSDEDGAAKFGLDSQGKAHIQADDGSWNNLEDESWDGYLEDASFADQHGSASSFEPAEIMGNADLNQIKGEKDTLLSEINSLKSEEEGLVSNVSVYDSLRRNAESNFEAASADYERYSAMDDSDFEDTDQTRFDAEQKSLELTQRTATIGQHLQNNETLVSEDDKSLLTHTRSEYYNTEQSMSREMGQDEILLGLDRYDNEGLIETNNNLNEVNTMLAAIGLVVEASGFEEASLEFDEIVSGSVAGFTQGVSDLNGAMQNVSDAASLSDEGGLIVAEAGVNEILTNLETAANSNELTASYENMTDLLSTEFTGEESDGEYGNAGIFLTEAITENFSISNNVLIEDLNAQADEYAELDTDTARASVQEINEQIEISGDLVEFYDSTNERVAAIANKVSIDFGDINEEEARELYDSHKEYQEDLNTQKTEFEALDTDLARSSLADINIYEKVNNKILEELESQYGLGSDTVNDE